MILLSKHLVMGIGGVSGVRGFAVDTGIPIH